MLYLKDKAIDSKESLIKVINILDTLSRCSTSVDEHINNSDKNTSMNEITNLKTEAKRLLDEVNHLHLSNTNINLFIDNIHE